MKESFAVQVNAAEEKFVHQVLDELDKNHRANDQPDNFPGKLPENHVQLKLLNFIYLSLIKHCHACGQGRERRKILAILMKSGIAMCPSRKIR